MGGCLYTGVAELVNDNKTMIIKGGHVYVTAPEALSNIIDTINNEVQYVKEWGSDDNHG